MRRSLTFTCDARTLVASLDEASGTTGLLIVSGGNEIRSGAHRGMATLAAEIAGLGWPVLRFDRRGIGDSEGENRGFMSSASDIAAALAAFRRECPQLRCVLGFGNCDAATALILHGAGLAARVLANPWVIEMPDALPPPAAIRDRYARRVRDPQAWAALLTGKIDLKALGKGLGRITQRKTETGTVLADRVVERLSERSIPTTIVLCSGDATAIAFDAVWKTAPVPGIEIVRVDSASHSFANDADQAALAGTLSAALSRADA